MPHIKRFLKVLKKSSFQHYRFKFEIGDVDMYLLIDPHILDLKSQVARYS